MTFAGSERRKHARHALTCPVVIADADGKELFQGRTVNVSDGGMLLPAGDDPLTPGDGVYVNLRVPRRTANTFMYEEFSSPAEVVRLQPAAVAVKFPRPLELGLVV